MGGVYFTKKELYREVARMKNNWGMCDEFYNIDLVKLCKMHNIIVESVPFKTKGLRGMAVLGDLMNSDIILLSSMRNKIEQNYDCGHELLHLNVHREVGLNSFNCFDKIVENQNPFYEWHANEGSAELFVPYKVLLPIIKKYISTLNTYESIESFKNYLSQIFNVPVQVVKYRLDNLRYEIYQYINGIAIDDIEIISLNQQRVRNIYVKSLNDIAEEDYFAKL